MRISFVCKSIGLSLQVFYKEVVAKCLLVFGSGLIIPILMHNYLPVGILSSLVTCVVACITFTALVLLFGFNKNDRDKIKQMVLSKIKR